jgi:hypothetical protein
MNPLSSKKWSIAALGILTNFVIFCVVAITPEPEVVQVAVIAIPSIAGITGAAITLQGLVDKKALTPGRTPG